MQTHNLDTVVILGDLNPDGDAAGSVMSLAHYIHVNYPQYRVFPYLAKTLERGPKKMVVEDKIFVPFQMPDISGKQLHFRSTEQKICWLCWPCQDQELNRNRSLR